MFKVKWTRGGGLCQSLIFFGFDYVVALADLIFIMGSLVFQLETVAEIGRVKEGWFSRIFGNLDGK